MANSRHIGPLPTIADSKRLGMTGFRVECATLYCYHTKRVEFDALGLPDDIVFIEIPKLRRFVCERLAEAERRQSLRIGLNIIRSASASGKSG
jgi:hypothetical protein